MTRLTLSLTFRRPICGETKGDHGSSLRVVPLSTIFVALRAAGVFTTSSSMPSLTTILRASSRNYFQVRPYKGAAYGHETGARNHLPTPQRSTCPSLPDAHEHHPGCGFLV